MEKELLNQKKEKRVHNNLKNTETKELNSLAYYIKDIKFKNPIRTQGKGSRLVLEIKEQFIK